MEGRLLKYFFQEICFSGGKQTKHKVSAAFIVKNYHPRTSLIDDQSCGNNKQSSYERAEKIVEGIVDELCLIFSAIKAVSLQLGRGAAK